MEGIGGRECIVRGSSKIVRECENAKSWSTNESGGESYSADREGSRDREPPNWKELDVRASGKRSVVINTKKMRRGAPQ